MQYIVTRPNIFIEGYQYMGDLQALDSFCPATLQTLPDDLRKIDSIPLAGVRQAAEATPGSAIT